MEVANKLVTLADLKAAYDDLKATYEDLRRKANMWEDITDQLTFSAATWYPYPYSSEDWTKNTSGARGSSATIPVTPGERYRVTGWSCSLSSTDNSMTFLAALTNSSDTLVGAYATDTSLSERQGSTNLAYFRWNYGSREFTIPRNATTLVVFSYGGVRGKGSSVDDVILEKLVQ